MTHTAVPPTRPAAPPEAFRAALAELVQIGMSAARLIGRIAEAEAAALDAVARQPPEDERPIAVSLAEAIEADRAIAAAAEAQAGAMERAELVTRAFTRVSRSVRMTVLLAERLDRGWARKSRTDDRAAMALRQVERGVADAIAADVGPDESRAERLGEALALRLEEAEVAETIGERPAEEIIDAICRDLGVNRLRRTVAPPVLPENAVLAAGMADAAAEMPAGWTVQTTPWVGGMCVRVEDWERPAARGAPG